MFSHPTTSTDRRRRRRGLSVVATSLAVLASGCSGGGDDRGEVLIGPTTTASSIAASPATSSSSSTSTERPPGTSAGTQPGPRGSVLPFAGDTAPKTSSEVEGYPVLVSVRQGEHEGYRRYVFTFRHADPAGHQPWRQFARPAWDVRYVPSDQAVQDGSGEPVGNAGAKAHLRIRFDADMHYTDGRSSLTQSVNDESPDLVFAGDFENRVTWFYGAAAEQPFRVTWVGDGRVAVDVVR